MATEIPKASTLQQTVFTVNNCATFKESALDVFHYQYQHNAIYQRFCNSIGKHPYHVKHITDIPFLPVSLFKTHAICTTEFEPKLVFESSGTTGAATSRHLVKEPSIYEKSFLQTFETFYGPVADYCILGLLPSYMERSQSSLVYMVNELIKRSRHPLSSFYLNDYAKLADTLKTVESQGKKTLLIGVTYALLDFAAACPMPLLHTIVMETGGMKGRKTELVRSEVHTILKNAFTLQAVHSEYGMTELLSQAYAFENGRFHTPAWMKVLIRQEDDPLEVSVATQKPISGGINIIDLANIYSCSFIAIEDLGRLYNDGTFEVLGRIDNTDIRGCSLLSF